MSARRKGYRLENAAVRAARAKGLPAQRVPMSGQLGRRGGTAADVVVAGWRCEVKNWRRGISTAVIEQALLAQRAHAVIHKRAGGLTLVSMAYEDWLDLLAGAKTK
jgi:hypothetical protein